MAETKTAPPDERDIETKRLTSHLDNFKLVESAAVEADEQVQVDPLKLTDDVGKVLELLRESQSLPSTTKTEQAIKQHRVRQITDHLHAIQQGPATPVLTSTNSQALATAQNENAEQIFIESMGRQFPVIKKLAAELASTTAELAAATAALAQATTELEALKSKKK